MNATPDSIDQLRIEDIAHNLGCTPAQLKFARENIGDDQDRIVRFLTARGLIQRPRPME
ncbi:MAG: hypothetical protein ABI846_01785 [Rudaea sp.]